MSLDFGSDFDFRGLEALLDDVIPDAVRDGLEVVKDDAVERAPAEDGDLRASAKVDHEVAVDVGGVTGSFRFEAPWARKEEVHLYYHHHGEGGAKYAELALARKGPAAIERIGEHIKAALE